MKCRHTLFIGIGIALLLTGAHEWLMSQVIVAKDLTVQSVRQIDGIAEESTLKPKEQEAIAAHSDRILLCNRHYRRLAHRRLPRLALILSFTGVCLMLSGGRGLLTAKKHKGKSNTKVEPSSKG